MVESVPGMLISEIIDVILKGPIELVRIQKGQWGKRWNWLDGLEGRWEGKGWIVGWVIVS